MLRETTRKAGAAETAVPNPKTELEFAAIPGPRSEPDTEDPNFVKENSESDSETHAW